MIIARVPRFYVAFIAPRVELDHEDGGSGGGNTDTVVMIRGSGPSRHHVLRVVWLCMTIPK